MVGGNHMIKRFIVIFILFAMLLPVAIQAADTGYNKDGNRNIFEDFYYRLVLKDSDERDFYDYVLFASLNVGLLIVMIFQNTKTYIVMVPINNKDDKNDINKSNNKEVIKEDKNKPKKYYHKKKPYQRKKKIEDTN